MRIHPLDHLVLTITDEASPSAGFVSPKHRLGGGRHRHRDDPRQRPPLARKGSPDRDIEWKFSARVGVACRRPASPKPSERLNGRSSLDPDIVEVAVG
jgi:hypothetical protein